MKISHLDGDTLGLALQSGIHSVIADQTYLNKINVFPVADGDTGTNLSLSMSAALGVLRAPGEKHLGTLLAATADALLDGARGNSGAIMAQFFQGLSDSAGELTRFTTATFSKAVRTGSDYAHDALSNPREGTILSLIAEFANSFESQVKGAEPGNFADVFAQTMPRLDAALARTTGQLDELRKAGVVDAGAKGFVDLISGISKYLQSGEMVAMPDVSQLLSAEEMEMPQDTGDEYEYRYCTECIVTGADIDRRKLREALAKLGDSLVLAGSKRKAKIHIHVNDAQAVFDVARSFGDIRGEKADDLHQQQVSSHNLQKKFAVITDSAADIADSDMDRLDIHMVPCRIQFGKRGYLDKVSITTDEFYERLQSDPNHPTTSQPAPGDFRRQYQYLASHFPDVISVNLTSAASGTYEAARSAAERTDAAGNVHVINTLNASFGEGLLAVFAAECGAAGLSAKTTIEAVNSLIPHTYTYCVIGDLDCAVRGGRVPNWVKILANTMRMTPVIATTPNGEIKLATCLFGRRNIAARFAKYVAKQTDDSKTTIVGIAHAVSADKLEIVESTLREKLQGIQRIAIGELGTALGVHGGPGTLLISTIPYVNPESLVE
ncbi:MAG: DegV family protein [Woeseiaceae bacterium]